MEGIMEKYKLISAHRRDDGTVVAEVEPADRVTIADLERAVEDMLKEVGDNGEIVYDPVLISPEVIMTEKFGEVTVFEMWLRPKAYLLKVPTRGPDADEKRSLQAQAGVRGWRV
jgi:hypothetical protein